MKTILKRGDPVAVVLEQDECVSERGIDYSRWTETVFIPLTLVADGRFIPIDSDDALIEHLRALERKARELGITALRTEILSLNQRSEGLAIIRSIRHRLSATGHVIGSSSMTWSLIRLGTGWKINQIHFNDSTLNPSVVAQTFLGRGNER